MATYSITRFLRQYCYIAISIIEASHKHCYIRVSNNIETNDFHNVVGISRALLLFAVNFQYEGRLNVIFKGLAVMLIDDSL